MKFKIVMIIALIWIGQSSFGQVSDTNSSVENNDTKNQEALYTQGSISEQQAPHEHSDIFYSKKEWKKIKKQIRRNKKRITNSNEEIHNSKVLDTIYLEIKSSKSNSQITDW